MNLWRRLIFNPWYYRRPPCLFKAAFNFNFLRKNLGAQVHNVKNSAAHRFA